MHYRLCIFHADMDKVKAINKAWIPVSSPTKWNEEAVAEEIKTLAPTWKAADTLRLSKVSGKTYNQLTIATGIVGTNLKLLHTTGDLDLSVECKEEDQWTAADYVKVDWHGAPFNVNVKGVPQ